MRQIGNAVPVKLAQIIGTSIYDHLQAITPSPISTIPIYDFRSISDSRIAARTVN